MAVVRDGIYLEDNPPTRSQFLVGRRDPGIKANLVVHTAESGTDTAGPDPKAENVANFIRRRSDAGSYHLLGDSDSIIQLIRFDNEAYHCKGGANRWSIGISLAMNAADWRIIPAGRRVELLDTAAQMTAIAAQWLQARGIYLPAKWLTREQWDAGLPGITSHANADPTPGRRSDPGALFPVGEYLQRFEALRSGGSVGALAGSGARTVPEMLREALRGHSDGVAVLQQALNARDDAGLVVDGIWGPKTEGALTDAIQGDLDPIELPGLVIAVDPTVEAGTVIYRKAL